MRLFVAFEIPKPIRQQLTQRCREVRGALPAARWVLPESMHMTLAFLGETSSGLLPGLHQELEATFATCSPMQLTLRGVGAFPARGRRRVAWIGVEASGDLHGLQSRVTLAAERAVGGARDPLRFHSHVTLARCKQPWPPNAVSRLASSLSDWGESFDAVAGSLIASTLLPTGPQYRTVGTYPLQGTP